MKNRKIWRRATFALLIASVVLVSSCEKIKLNWPPWQNPEKKAASETTGFDWPRWRGPDGNGVSKEADWDFAALAKGPKILWKFNTGSSYSNVAIKGKFLYTMGGDYKFDIVYCIDAEKGKLIWTYKCRSNRKMYPTPATPTVDGDSLYTLGSGGDLYCFDARKGTVKWHKNLVKDYKVLPMRYGFAASPVVEGNLLIVTCNSYGIALDKKTGGLVWESPTTDANSKGCSMIDAYATPVIYSLKNTRYVCQFDDYGLYSVDMGTGKPSWFFSWPPVKSGGWANVADPIVFDEKVFISTGYGVGCVLLDISSGNPKVLWQNKNMNNHVSTCVLIDGYLYGCHDPVGWGGGGILRCLDLKSGEVMWEKDYGSTVSLSAAGSMLIVLVENGTLSIAEASPNSYNEISCAQVFDKTTAVKCWTPPVLCGGKIYCRNYAGDIVCIDVRK